MLILDQKGYFQSDGLGSLILEVNSSNPDSVLRWINKNEIGQAFLSNKLIIRKINRLVKSQISWNEVEIFRTNIKRRDSGERYVPQKIIKFLDSLKNEERNLTLDKYWNVRVFGWEADGETLVAPCINFHPGQSLNSVRTFQTKRNLNGRFIGVEAIDYALFTIPFYFDRNRMEENRCSEKDIILFLRMLHKLFRQDNSYSESYIKVRFAYYIPNVKGDCDNILRLLTPPARLFPGCSAHSWLDYDASAYEQQIVELKQSETVIDCLELI